jgi:hydrogenase expression/formation protein HypC
MEDGAMCLAVPGKVLEKDGMDVTVDFGGTRRRARADLTPDIVVGEYALVHAGFVIQKLDAAEAERTLEYLREMGEHAPD